MSDYPNGTYATILVDDGESKEWPVVERFGNGWMSGAHYYPDRKVESVRVINVASPPRTITTVDELDALPEGSVIRGQKHYQVACKEDAGCEKPWATCGLPHPQHSTNYTEWLPVTVLHEPGAQS